MKILSFIITSLALGCQTAEIPDNISTANGPSAWITGNVQYGRDDRTGLCFAAYRPTYNSSLLTTVPCTPAVEALIPGSNDTNTH